MQTPDVTGAAALTIREALAKRPGERQRDKPKGKD
jgi:hypothetical protein